MIGIPDPHTIIEGALLMQAIRLTVKGWISVTDSDEVVFTACTFHAGPCGGRRAWVAGETKQSADLLGRLSTKRAVAIRGLWATSVALLPDAVEVIVSVFRVIATRELSV